MGLHGFGWCLKRQNEETEEENKWAKIVLFHLVFMFCTKYNFSWNTSTLLQTLDGVKFATYQELLWPHSKLSRLSSPELRGQEFCLPQTSGQCGQSYLCIFPFCSTASGRVWFIVTFCLLLFFYCKVIWDYGMTTGHQNSIRLGLILSAPVFFPTT